MTPRGFFCKYCTASLPPGVFTFRILLDRVLKDLRLRYVMRCTIFGKATFHGP